MLRELWDDSVPDPVVSSTYGSVLNLADRLQATCELAKEELVKDREVQRSYFDRKAELREFLPGDKCLLLMPTSHNKLLATWRGPFEVVARNSEVNYTIQVGHHKTKRFHVNMLKRYIEPQQAVASMSVGKERVTGHRTSEQLGCLRLVRKQFQDEVRELVGCATVISEEAENDVGLETAQARQSETWKNVAVSDCLASGQKDEAVSLCREFAHVFSDKPGQAQVEPHRIELINEFPVKTKPYSIPLRLVDDVKAEINAMVEAGIIESTLWGLYQFTVLPFGLTNAPAVFNRTMRDVLHDVPGTEVFVDDVLVHTESFEEHMVVLRKVLERLSAAGMTVKPSKTELGQTVIQYLGHKWEMLPNPREPFTLRTDASQDAVGAVLLQEQDGWLCPVAYHSRKLRAAERNYSTIERELLAVVDGIKKFQFYLYGGNFVLETDHMPLEHLKPSKTANARLTRWGLYLQQFDYTLRYIRGNENVGADLLSRLGNK
ncbi:uncharacterized protein LOC143032638 [Oratosquilla oratoria]|uniref:uncharacterized protein LOC143032638 n=1 Tax=Oratosquilla oratoria TaxID=337810 RepID=UPI003F75F4A8